MASIPAPTTIFERLHVQDRATTPSSDSADKGKNRLEIEQTIHKLPQTSIAKEGGGGGGERDSNSLQVQERAFSTSSRTGDFFRSTLLSPDARLLQTTLLEREVQGRENECVNLRHHLNALKGDFEMNLRLLSERDATLARQDTELQEMTEAYSKLYGDAIQQNKDAETRQKVNEEKLTNEITNLKREIKEIKSNHDDELQAILNNISIEHEANVKALEREMQESFDLQLDRIHSEHTTKIMELMTKANTVEETLARGKIMNGKLAKAEEELKHTQQAMSHAHKAMNSMKFEIKDLNEKLTRKENRIRELNYNLKKAAEDRGALLAENEAKILETHVEAEARQEAETKAQEIQSKLDELDNKFQQVTSENESLLKDQNMDIQRSLLLMCNETETASLDVESIADDFRQLLSSFEETMQSEIKHVKVFKENLVQEILCIAEEVTDSKSMMYQIQQRTKRILHEIGRSKTYTLGITETANKEDTPKLKENLRKVEPNIALLSIAGGNLIESTKDLEGIDHKESRCNIKSVESESLSLIDNASDYKDSFDLTFKKIHSLQGLKSSTVVDYETLIQKYVKNSETDIVYSKRLNHSKTKRPSVDKKKSLKKMNNSMADKYKALKMKLSTL